MPIARGSETWKARLAMIWLVVILRSMVVVRMAMTHGVIQSDPGADPSGDAA